MFVDFTHPALFEEKAKYEKGAINIMKNSFTYKKKAMKLMKSKYLSGPEIDEKDDKGKPIKVRYPQLKDLQKMLDAERVRENIYDTIFQKIKKLGFTFVDNLNDKSQVNMFRGFKLVKSNGAELTHLEMSNFINSINSGLVEKYPVITDLNKNSLINQEEDIMLSESEEPYFIETHSTKKPSHFDGFIEDLLDYYYHSCTGKNCDMIKKADKIMTNQNKYVQNYLKQQNLKTKTNKEKVEELLKNFGINDSNIGPSSSSSSGPTNLDILNAMKEENDKEEMMKKQMSMQSSSNIGPSAMKAKNKYNMPYGQSSTSSSGGPQYGKNQPNAWQMQMNS
jgi:hypothetical protein